MAVPFRTAVPRGGWKGQGRDHPGAQSPVAMARAGGGDRQRRERERAGGEAGGRAGGGKVGRPHVPGLQGSMLRAHPVQR